MVRHPRKQDPKRDSNLDNYSYDGRIFLRGPYSKVPTTKHVKGLGGLGVWGLGV